MKRNVINYLAVLLILTSCSNSCARAKNDSNNESNTNGTQQTGGMPGGQFGGPGGFGQGVEIIDDGSTTNYTDTTTAAANAVIADDLYSNFVEEGTVTINFTGTSWTTSFSGVSESDVSIKAVSNSAEDEQAAGVEIQYKGKLKLKYVLSGTFNGTVFIKNKSADAAVVLNGANITSSDGAGPALRFSSEKRTPTIEP